MEPARLTIRREDGATGEVVLGSFTTIGRTPGNTIVLEDPKVSRQHAVIRVHENGSYVLTDLGSSNGTLLNGRRVLLPSRLVSGDVVRVAAVTLTFVHRGAERAAGRIPPAEDATLTADPAEHEITVLGACPAMAEVFRLMDKAAAADIAVLVEGETGTGKELVARAIHWVSARGKQPFVAINCAALPEALLESQLFGHRRGAFTGADRDRGGLFEAANGGTIFLDEVGEMPAAMQAKLLRVLQEGELVPVGDTQPRRVDVRVISATNRRLEGEVERGVFRQDLYYRLAAFPIMLPPLRERREDIPLLADRFLAQAAHRQRRRPAGIEPAALDCLVRYAWPGNVRQLHNELHRAVVLAGDGEPIDVTHLSAAVAGAGDRSAIAFSASMRAATNGTASAGPLAGARAAFEARYIAEALRQQGGNVSRAAEALGLSRVALHRKIKEYGLR